MSEAGFRWGAVVEVGGVTFRVWAPSRREVGVAVGGTALAMAPVGDGVFEVHVPGLGAGADYMFVLDAQDRRPDPASRRQPAGVHGPSRVVDPAGFAWSDTGWKGLPLDAYVIYELHVGTFTRAGTFDAVIDRLDYLKDLGVTAVEIMPVASFPGTRNWGYDGTYLFAPQESYGGPEGLRRLVDACHRRGLAFILDVVYNHLGPDGNYLACYGPYFTNRYHTPWGDAVNFDGPGSDGVRRLFIDNALYWLTEFHVDALRLDAIHGIYDVSARHILAEMNHAFTNEARRLGRQAHLIAESDLNDTRVVDPVERGGHALAAQWSDDFHHALWTVCSGARRGYFEDFGRMEDLRKALTSGFVYDGAFSRHRGRRHGNSSRHVPGRQLVVYTQNHDQIANGSQGARVDALLGPERARVLAAVLFASPYVPMLFMGQEYGELNPFLYFVSHENTALVQAIREGRRAEFAAFGGEGFMDDPQSEETLARSRLDWDRLDSGPHALQLAFFREICALRRTRASLANMRKDLLDVRVSADDARDRWLTIQRRDPSGEVTLLLANLGERPCEIPTPPDSSRLRVLLASDDRRFGGHGDGATATSSGTLPPWTARLLGG
jgi:maltooligosyltrehalose trehalohydrolase